MSNWNAWMRGWVVVVNEKWFKLIRLSRTRFSVPATTPSTQTHNSIKWFYFYCLPRANCHHTTQQQKNEFKVIQQNGKSFSIVWWLAMEVLWLDGYILSRTRHAFQVDKRRKYVFHIAHIVSKDSMRFEWWYFLPTFVVWLHAGYNEKNKPVSMIISFSIKFIKRAAKKYPKKVISSTKS